MNLVVMAAGMGSRFGGLKQIEPVGPHGEFIILFMMLLRLVLIRLSLLLKRRTMKYLGILLVRGLRSI